MSRHPSLDALVSRLGAAGPVPVSAAAVALTANPDARELRATLEAFVTSGLNVRRAAAAVHAHPNTIRYRLRKLAAMVGATGDAELSPDAACWLLLECRLAESPAWDVPGEVAS